MRRIMSVFVLFTCLSTPVQLTGKPQINGSGAALAGPQLIDPGFEMFTLAPGPIFGWYSDDLQHADEPGFARVTMTPDDTDRVEGEYSLHIHQTEPRPEGQGFVALSQIVQLPDLENPTRRFTLSVSMKGKMNLPLTIVLYVWGEGFTAQEIARRGILVGESWSTAKLKFKLPRGQNQFGIWFYLPDERGAQLWLDDVRLRPREN
jgi:hypothetical protein